MQRWLAPDGRIVAREARSKSGWADFSLRANEWRAALVLHLIEDFGGLLS